MDPRRDGLSLRYFSRRSRRCEGDDASFGDVEELCWSGASGDRPEAIVHSTRRTD
jgi:hypothetical protein